VIPLSDEIALLQNRIILQRAKPWTFQVKQYLDFRKRSDTANSVYQNTVNPRFYMFWTTLHFCWIWWTTTISNYLIRSNPNLVQLKKIKSKHIFFNSVVFAWFAGIVDLRFQLFGMMLDVCYVKSVICLQSYIVLWKQKLYTVLPIRVLIWRDNENLGKFKLCKCRPQ